MRVIRITRILRFVRALQTLVESIVHTIKHLVWAAILLFLIIYMFAIVFAQASDQFLQDYENTLEPALAFDLRYYWGSLGRAILTLFASVTSGVSWDVVARPLGSISVWWELVFVAYVVFTYLAVLNVITGVFCQAAIASTQADKDSLIHNHLKQKTKYMAKIKSLFNIVDTDDDGSITIRELEENLRDPRVKAYFGALEIEMDDIFTLFRLLDTDRSNCLDLEEFLMGCMRLRGNARATDIANLSYEIRWLAKRMVASMSGVTEDISSLKRHLPQSCSKPELAA